MKTLARAVGLVALLCLTACGPPRWQTATFDEFSINRGRARAGTELIKVIALVPGGGVVADAVGVELAKRGFVIVPQDAASGMIAGVDLKAVREHHIPARVNHAEMALLRARLLAHGVDVFMIVRAEEFAPRAYLGHSYWQRVFYTLYSTRRAGVGFFGDIGGSTWINIDPRAKSLSDAAVEIVESMAVGGAL